MAKYETITAEHYKEPVVGERKHRQLRRRGLIRDRRFKGRLVGHIYVCVTVLTKRYNYVFARTIFAVTIFSEDNF